MITLRVYRTEEGGEDDSLVTINTDSTINLGKGKYGTVTHSPFLQHVSW